MNSNNIIEWGCNLRSKDLEDFHNRLYSYEGVKFDERMAEGNAGGRPNERPRSGGSNDRG